MTCIAGVEADGCVWLAGDAEWSTKKVRSNSVHPKVWVRDGIAWGMSGDDRPAAIMRYVARLPSLPKRAPDVAEWMACEMVPSIRKALGAEGCEGEWGLLLGIRDEIWELDSNQLPAMRAAEGYAAIGCAQPAALVGLALTAKLSPRARVIRVVAACSKHIPGVGGKITAVCNAAQ